jgi:hypothetical protein
VKEACSKAKQESTPQREEMINYLHDRAYPLGKKGRRIGAEQFFQGLRDQPTNVLEALVSSAKKYQEFRSDLRKLRK